MTAEASGIYYQKYEKKQSHESMTKPTGIQMISITPYLWPEEIFQVDQKAPSTINQKTKQMNTRNGRALQKMSN